MSNVINIKNFREESKKMIETRAFEQYGVIKANEDLYLYPEIKFVTGTPELKSLFKDELKMEVSDLFEKEVIDEINQLIPAREQRVTIMLVKEEENNMLTFDIFNMSTNKNFLISTPMNFTEENRRIFTGLVAGAIDKVDVMVTFFLKLRYEEVERMIR